MKSNKIVLELLDAEFEDIKKILDKLNEGQSAKINGNTVISLGREKLTHAKETHYIRIIDVNGKFVANIGVQ